MHFIGRLSGNHPTLFFLALVKFYDSLFSLDSVPFIEKKGYLYKMGGQRKTWKLRYFVLRPGAFNYSKDSRSAKPISEVKLKNLSIFFPGIGELGHCCHHQFRG